MTIKSGVGGAGGGLLLMTLGHVGQLTPPRAPAIQTFLDAAGAPGDQLVLHGNNKSIDELRSAREVGATIVVDSFDELNPRKLFRRIDPQVTKTYYDLFEWLEPGQLLIDGPGHWRSDWTAAAAKTVEPDA